MIHPCPVSRQHRLSLMCTSRLSLMCTSTDVNKRADEQIKTSRSTMLIHLANTDKTHEKSGACWFKHK